MPESYYIFVKGEKEGPYSLEEIGTMLEDEVLSFQDYCIAVGESRRVRLDFLFEEIPEEEQEDGEDDEEWEWVEDDAEEGDDSEEEYEYEEEGDEGEAEEADEGLPEGKRIYFSGHPSFLKYPVAWILCLGSALGGYFLGPTSLWYFIAGSLVAVAIIGYIVVDRTTRRYIVTARRVEFEWGLIVKSSNEVRIRDIRTVNVRKSGLMGLIGIGTIEFSSTGDGIDVAFSDVWAAHRVKRLVREIQDTGEDEEEWE